MATTTTLLTAEQFFRLPDEGTPRELLRGEVVMMNMPGYRHGYVCINIAFALRDYLATHDLGTVAGNDSGIVTTRDPDSVRGADIAFFSYQRLPKGSVPEGYPPVAPELVFEVKSPSDAWKDLHTKVAEYLQAGVNVACVVDPEHETATAYYATRPETIFRGNDTLTFFDILPGFRCPVRKLFHA